MTTWGMNGNYSEQDITGKIKYLGDGEWKLPRGWSASGGHGDDWIITDSKGNEYHVWTEE